MADDGSCLCPPSLNALCPTAARKDCEMDSLYPLFESLSTRPESFSLRSTGSILGCFAVGTSSPRIARIQQIFATIQPDADSYLYGYGFCSVKIRGNLENSGQSGVNWLWLKRDIAGSKYGNGDAQQTRRSTNAAVFPGCLTAPSLEQRVGRQDQRKRDDRWIERNQRPRRAQPQDIDAPNGRGKRYAGHGKYR